MANVPFPEAGVEFPPVSEADLNVLSSTKPDEKDDLEIKEDVPDWEDSSSGEIDLNDTKTETVVEIPQIPRGTKESKPTMTSAEFWKSPIRPPKPSVAKSSNMFSKRQKDSNPPQVKKIRHEEKDGRVWEVKVLEGYSGMKPLPENKVQVGGYEVTEDGRIQGKEGFQPD